MFNLKSKQKDKVVIVGQKEIEKREKLMGRFKRHPGHTVFEFNYGKMELKKAKFEEQIASYERQVNTNGMVTVHRKIIINEDCYYFSALNYDNAVKKLVKRGIIGPKQNLNPKSN